MKKPQWITVLIAIVLVGTLFVFGRTTPKNKTVQVAEVHGPGDGHDHGPEPQPVSIDTILALARKELTQEQGLRLNMLENSISRGDVKDQQLHIYHQLAKFWRDSVRIFEPYAWYQAQAARLENSEKTLTFAAQQFLDNMQNDQVANRRQWKALQAKDLFERSLKINPDNDSAKIGLGACYLFGNISSAPMEGIALIREVADKDSTNVYAQMTLVRGSLLSEQYDKAVSRLETVIRVQPGNPDPMVLLGDVHSFLGNKKKASDYYSGALQFIRNPDYLAEVQKRIAQLKK